jgi:hypothetical protein
MIHVLTPEDVLVPRSISPKIFLAGSIEMGTAADWQAQAIKFFDGESKKFQSDVVIYNPRCKFFDRSLEQSIDNPRFNHQVSWELYNLEWADAVIMYLDPNTISPISLLELGFLAGSQNTHHLNKVVVCCPDGFHRQGNVDIVCHRYNIKVVRTLPELFDEGLHILQRNHDRRTTSSEWSY